MYPFSFKLLGNEMRTIGLHRTQRVRFKYILGRSVIHRELVMSTL